MNLVNIKENKVDEVIEVKKAEFKVSTEEINFGAINIRTTGSDAER